MIESFFIIPVLPGFFCFLFSEGHGVDKIRGTFRLRLDTAKRSAFCALSISNGQNCKYDVSMNRSQPCFLSNANLIRGKK